MNKILEFIRNDHIKAATASGICIIALALYFKKVAHIDVPYLENAAPGFIFTIYESVKAKSDDDFWEHALPWSLLMFLATGFIMLRHLP
jgi:hypothetical protein